MFYDPSTILHDSWLLGCSVLQYLASQSRLAASSCFSSSKSRAEHYAWSLGRRTGGICHGCESTCSGQRLNRARGLPPRELVRLSGCTPLLESPIRTTVGSSCSSRSENRRLTLGLWLVKISRGERTYQQNTKEHTEKTELLGSEIRLFDLEFPRSTKMRTSNTRLGWGPSSFIGFQTYVAVWLFPGP